MRLAQTFERLGRLAESEVYFRKCLRITERDFGPDQRDTVLLLQALVKVVLKQRKFEEALPLAERTLVGLEPMWDVPRDRSKVYRALYDYALALIETGSPLEAEPLVLRAIEGGDDSVRHRLLRARIQVARGEVEEGVRQMTELEREIVEEGTAGEKVLGEVRSALAEARRAEG